MKRFLLAVIILQHCFAIQAQAYRKLHKKAIVVDTHNDFTSVAVAKKISLDADLTGKTQTDLARLKKGGIDVQVFSIFCGPAQQQPYAFANQEIDSVEEWARRNPGKMLLVRTPGQLNEAVKQHRLAAMMGVEGGHMIEDDLSKLDSLYERGVRYMTLTWNNSTGWATSAKDETEKGDSLPSKGLNAKGKEVVKRMNELGMLVDVSHVGEQTFRDVINTTTKPIIASHSAAWHLCHHRRNLKDEQIKAIAKNGGVIQVNFYAGFIDSNYQKLADKLTLLHKKEADSLIAAGTQPDDIQGILAEKYKAEMIAIRPPLSVLIDHIDYIAKLAGVDHVGLGSDFDGIEAAPKELEGVEDYPLITKALLQRGYSKADIKKILGENFIRVFKAAQTH